MSSRSPISPMDGAAARIQALAAASPSALVRLPLFALPPPVFPGPDAAVPEAAVLVGVFDLGGEPHFLVTKRSSELRHHGGECSFPGGKRDAVDGDIVACALREAREEIGIDVPREDVLAVCEPGLSKFGLRVFPVVARLPPDVLDRVALSGAEVSHAFPLALRAVLADGFHHWHRDASFAGMPWRAHMFWVQHGGRDFAVWGLTAAVAIAVAAAMSGASPDYVVLHPEHVSSALDSAPAAAPGVGGARRDLAPVSEEGDSSRL